jgi:homoserine O-acetyltransferase
MTDNTDLPPECGSEPTVGWTRAESVRLATVEKPFVLETGARIGPVDVEFETYGRLSPGRDNAVLICHALSGDAHVAGWDSEADEPCRKWRKRKPGWWDAMVGPGKPIDTDEFFVVCANILGSCYGTTGPSSVNPHTDEPYGLAFPMVSVNDWVRLQALLLDSMHIERLHAVVGGSLGGQQALEWAIAFPERVASSLILAASPRLSSQGLAFNAVGRHAIMTDPHFAGGDYYGGELPRSGLAAARMLAHITYLSEESMRERFGRKLRAKQKPDLGFDIEFEVESYLHHQGQSFVERFDANSYLYITRAMDYYDAAASWGGGDLLQACSRVASRVLVVSFSSDWLYPPAECKSFAIALTRSGRATTYIDIPSNYGHDAFLVQTDELGRLLWSFLRRRGPGRL